MTTYTLPAATIDLREAAFYPTCTRDSVAAHYLDAKDGVWIRFNRFANGTESVLAHPYGSRNGYECASVADAIRFFKSEYNVEVTVTTED